MTLEVDAGGMAVEVESSHQEFVSFIAVLQQQRSFLSKWSLTWKCVQSRGVIEFLHVEKIAPIDIHRHLLNVSGDQTVDVSKLKQWVVCFSSGESDVRDRRCSGWPSIAVSS
jgi:hypothetical protein